MPENQIEEIKSKVDIVALIGEHVHLNKAGTNFKGLCPFHQEKTPSFMVSPEMQIFKCFGCQTGGDVFKFLELYENMDFGEALRYLADKTGVKLAATTPADNDKQVLLEINNLAAKFYNYVLTSHPVGKIALNYLHVDRKINDDSIKAFNIGYAPHNKNSLSDFLIKKKKMSIKNLEKAGIIFVSQGGKVFDRFQGRIIFPICDHRGNVIALAGRLMPPERKDVGKYINSPETAIYHKSYSLYGLNTTKDFIKKEGFAVVTEGEIDLISSYQVGIKNVVAIKGSAFTPDQARLLSRFTKNVSLALDSDFAGQNAARRGIKILEEAGFSIKVVRLGKFKDPDDAVKADPEFLKKEVADAVPIWDFLIDSSVERFNPETAEGKQKISEDLTPVLADIENKIIQDHYIKKLATLLSADTAAVEEEVEKKTVNKDGKEDENQKPAETPVIPRQELLEESLIGLILKYDPKLLHNSLVKSVIRTPFAKRLLEEFAAFSLKAKEVTLGDFTKFLPKELLEKFSTIIFTVSELEEKELAREINETYKQLSIPLIKEKLRVTSDSKIYENLQRELKGFESGQFERIIK